MAERIVANELEARGFCVSDLKQGRQRSEYRLDDVPTRGTNEIQPPRLPLLCLFNRPPGGPGLAAGCGSG